MVNPCMSKKKVLFYTLTHLCSLLCISYSLRYSDKEWKHASRKLREKTKIKIRVSTAWMSKSFSFYILHITITSYILKEHLASKNYLLSKG